MDLAGDLESGSRNRARALADPGLAPHTACCGEGALQGSLEVAPHKTGVARGSVGRAHLAKDVRFTEHEALERACESKEMTQRRSAFVHIKRGRELVPRHAQALGQKSGEDPPRRLDPDIDGDKLDPVTGCKQDQVSETSGPQLVQL